MKLDIIGRVISVETKTSSAWNPYLQFWIGLFDSDKQQGMWWIISCRLMWNIWNKEKIIKKGNVLQVDWIPSFSYSQAKTLFYTSLMVSSFRLIPFSQKDNVPNAAWQDNDTSSWNTWSSVNDEPIQGIQAEDLNKWNKADFFDDNQGEPELPF